MRLGDLSFGQPRHPCLSFDFAKMALRFPKVVCGVSQIGKQVIALFLGHEASSVHRSMSGQR